MPGVFLIGFPPLFQRHGLRNSHPPSRTAFPYENRTLEIVYLENDSHRRRPRRLEVIVAGFGPVYTVRTACPVRGSSLHLFMCNSRTHTPRPWSVCEWLWVFECVCVCFPRVLISFPEFISLLFFPSL